MQFAWMPVNKPPYADLLAVWSAPQELGIQDYLAFLALRVQGLAARAKDPQAAADQFCENLADYGVLPEFTRVSYKRLADLLITADGLLERLNLLSLLPLEMPMRVECSYPSAEKALETDRTREPESRLLTIAMLLRP